MVDYNRDSVLGMACAARTILTAPTHKSGATRLLPKWATLLLMTCMLQGCGLVVDAVQLVHPIATNELDAICARGQVRVGMALVLVLIGQSISIAGMVAFRRARTTINPTKASRLYSPPSIRTKAFAWRASMSSSCRKSPRRFRNDAAAQSQLCRRYT